MLLTAAEEERTKRGDFWCIAEEKAFENALATVPLPAIVEANVAVAEDWWLERVASWIPGKTLAQVKQHFKLLVEDVKAIEDGRVPIPLYSGDESSSSSTSSEVAAKSPQSFFNHRAETGGYVMGGRDNCGSAYNLHRRKGTPWTKEEHRLFLLGLEKYGKGDWRSISRFCVVSRTPIQVASHAQKYFLRQNLTIRGRHRSSIHDITSATYRKENAAQGPITGQANVDLDAPVGRSMNHCPQSNMPAADQVRPQLVHPDCYGNTHQKQNMLKSCMISAAGAPGHFPGVFPAVYPAHHSSMH